jgi:hypothetical protein
MRKFSRLYLAKIVAAPSFTAQLSRIMDQVPIPKTLFDITAETNLLDKTVIENGKEIFNEIKKAYTAIGSLAILLKSDQVQQLRDHPRIIAAKSVLVRSIDSIGIAHAGVVARLSETMIGVLEKSLQESAQRDTLPENTAKIVQYYAMVMMREFPKKGHELMPVLEDFYALSPTKVSRQNAHTAMTLFEEIKLMWKDPLYYQGNMDHIHQLNGKLHTAAKLLGVSENIRKLSINPHICLLADAIKELKHEVGADDPTPVFTRGIFEHSDDFFTSAIGIVNANFEKEPDDFKKMGAAATWELTANFRAACLGQLMSATGVTDRLGRQPLYIPVHIPSEQEPYTAQDAQLLSYTADQESSFIEGSRHLTQEIMIPFYKELQATVMAEFTEVSKL